MTIPASDACLALWCEALRNAVEVIWSAIDGEEHDAALIRETRRWLEADDGDDIGSLNYVLAIHGVDRGYFDRKLCEVEAARWRHRIKEEMSKCASR